ncbi:MAG TPA: hypothetical protein ENN51_01200, partial [candidate division WOR-3 bacterium]|nr:hypothetical protein [candidate division WOR-3 bacterium]
MILLLLSLVAGAPVAPAVCGTPMFHRLALDGAPLPARPSLTRADVDRTADQGPEPGDTLMLWIWNMSVMPPTQYQAPFVCVDKGAHAYVMVHDSALAAGLVDSADAARIIERFE